MSRKNFELLLPGEHEYSRFNKVLTEDFEDVRTTPFMNDEVNEGYIEDGKSCEKRKDYEYEHFTWNSNYLGDKMRISLIWTRDEYVNTNKGVKHKSKSSKARDTKRLKTWQDKKENLHNDDDIDTSDIDTDSSEEDMSESSDEKSTNRQVDIPLVAPEKVNIRPVTKITQPIRVSINKSINKNNHESPPEKRVCRSSILERVWKFKNISVHTNIKECEHVVNRMTK
ncbi:Hypothetical predicted protein [Mytilus galloprovincialis]|uniref:Uncharacterized protein n=1 Tax=Mytilus galloprovincialis TaxID=29158 RepID=A0A8B6GIF9_MYTGA|nr:Hypothetical predicted protein [Mytilus galloprovincialis]